MDRGSSLRGLPDLNEEHAAKDRADREAILAAPPGVALAYKQLWMVEDIFRSMKSLLETRPVYHRTDAAIRGHVFCSFLALRLRAELESRLAQRAESLEWDSIVRDLDRLEEIEIEKQGTRFLLRNEAPGVAGKVFQAAGVALPPTLRNVS